MKYTERVGESAFGSVKGPRVYSFIKPGKRSVFLIVSYLNDNAFTAVKRDVKF